MILHYLKITWSRRKNHIFILITLFLSYFAVAFFASTWNHDLRSLTGDKGFEYEQVFQLEVAPKDNLPADVKHLAFAQLKANLSNHPAIESVTLTRQTVPFVEESNWRRYKIGEEQFWASTHRVGTDYARTLKIPVSEGTWLPEGMGKTPFPPVVINDDFAAFVFGEESPIGKTILDDETTVSYTVVGTIGAYQHMHDNPPGTPVIFTSIGSKDVPEFALADQVLLRFRVGTNIVDLQEDVEKIVAGTAIPGGWKLGQRDTLAASLDASMEATRAAVLVLIIVILILMGNIAIGILGAIWYSVIRRKSEIGVRRSMGSTKGGIYRLVVGEALTLATAAVVLGSIFFIQIPIFNFNHLTFESCLPGMGIGALIVYLLVWVCAYYPSRQASVIHPAIALYEE